jgi:hypothetical protein
MIDAAYVTLTIVEDQSLHAMRLIPSTKNNPNSFKLSKVCEAKAAKRIESNKTLEKFLAIHFPECLFGKYLPVIRLFDGSLLVNICAEQLLREE